MTEKNGVYKGTVTAYGTDGEGIIKTEGTTAFVPFCLVGESVEFKVLKVKNSVEYGKAERIIVPSPRRAEAPCPVFSKCGGCDLQHASYPEQLEFKRELVKNALKKIGGITCEVDETVPCEKPYRYRNKLAMPIGAGENGEAVLGFYAKRSHRIVPVNDCLIQSEWVKDVIEAVKNFARKDRLSGYDEVSRTGVLRHIVVREVCGKFIIALVAAKEINTDVLTKELKKKFSAFTLLLNVNRGGSNVIFSDDWRVCFGDGFFEAEDCGIKYRAGAETFLQVNDGVRAKLYKKAISEAAAEGSVAIDLYSGGGMLTAMLAKACGKAYGVEVVEEASRCAAELCRLNGLQGKMFPVTGKVEDKLDGIFAATSGEKRIVVCDPPRKGMERSVAEKLKTCGADRIILISCNPATLARDLGILTGALVAGENGELSPAGADTAEAQNPESGAEAARGKAATPAAGAYRIKSVTPFDMFPQTKHVETLVCLEKEI